MENRVGGIVVAASIGIRRWLWILFIALFIYLGIKLTPPWIGYYMIKYEVETKAKNANFYSDEEILRDIIGSAKTWGISLDEEDVEITRDYERIDIALDYDITVDFAGRYEKTFYYNIHTVKPIKAR